MKDGEHVLADELLPLRILSGNMTEQSSVRASASIQQKRQMRCEGKSVVLRDQQTEGVLIDELMQHAKVGLGKMGRDVHVGPRVAIWPLVGQVY